tara:strand:- start:86 stop:448 length:363 start_codon:yes stop_codon:yes gene_type:complete
MISLNFNLLNETSLQSVVGNLTKEIIKSMYGVDFRFDIDLINLQSLIKEQEEGLKFSIKGEPSQVKSYIKSVARMKFYLDAMMEMGHEHPMTAKRKEELDQATEEFERETGLSWPFKHEG